MTRHATLRALLLLTATLGLPIACGLGIEDDPGDPGPPPQMVPPIAYDYVQRGCSLDGECPLGCVCSAGSCVETALCLARGECSQGFSCDLTRQTCTPNDSAGGSAGTAGVAGAGGSPDLGGQTGGASSIAGSGGAAGVGGSFGDGIPGPIDAGTSEPPASDGGSCTSGGDCDRPAPCLTNDECLDGLCVNNACRSFCGDDAECRAGEGCVLGLCREDAEGLECIAATDCPDSDDCVGGRCLRLCLSAEHCVGCDDGPNCNLGYCGP